MKPVFLGSFSDAADVVRSFSSYAYSSDPVSDIDMTDVEILLASYSQGSYEGDAFVLFRKCGTLYEIHASHCSCYGLEGRWDPEETDIASLRYRIENGSLGDSYLGDGFKQELIEVLDALENENKDWE